jgi:hypothetical protein
VRRPQLYDAVALGGTLAVRARFHVVRLGPPLELPPRSLLVVTHRSNWDIPLACTLRVRARLGANPVFVARDDMFLRGFLGGFPRGLPRPLRRGLARVEIGPALRRHGLALPVASSERIHLVHAALEEPELPLAVLPQPDAERIRERASRIGRTAPERLGDALDPDYLDLLWDGWRPRAEVPELKTTWTRRRAVARRTLEALVAHLRAGGSLVVFPEGHPSPDGAVGPLERGLRLLVRRGEPELLVPVGLAYDPLAPGRARAYAAVGQAFAPAAEVGDAVLAALRRTLPLTAGQVAAHALRSGRDPHELAREALAEPRPREPELLRLLDESVAAARRAPAALVDRLDLEFRSARAAP